MSFILMNDEYIMWKSDLSKKIKQEFIQAVTVSVLRYGSTTWTNETIEEKASVGRPAKI